MNDLIEKYSVGALLYSPAVNPKIARKLHSGIFGSGYSMALCLEDTIGDDMLQIAEEQVKRTFEELEELQDEIEVPLPKIFIRVRESSQVMRIWDCLEKGQQYLTGFIFPKYTVHNAGEYNAAIKAVNEKAERKIWFMPILESRDIASPRTRFDVLSTLKDMIDSMSELVLNVRVGGNDFSNVYGLRRRVDQTIYDVRPVSQILCDILSWFSADYVVSGPVWEYFSGEGWKEGLDRELALDRLNGFIGKTVIHPEQIPSVVNSLKVSRTDYEDAIAICGSTGGLMVAKSAGGGRMNEVRTHLRWAEKTLALAEVYGIADTEPQYKELKIPI